MPYNPTEIYTNIMSYIMPYLYDICPSHGILHMQTVFDHAVKAVKAVDEDKDSLSFTISDKDNLLSGALDKDSSSFTISDKDSESLVLSDDIKSAIVIASFLHDIDDQKFFNTYDNDNARQIIRNIGQQKNEELIIKMIKYVSSSKNRNDITEECQKNPWLLIPRHCDRLEAIGDVGLQRVYRYTKTIHRKLFDKNTKKYNSRDELYCDELRIRYKMYEGKSETMIDHMYDKLLHICKDKVGNSYIDKIIEERNQILVDFCIAFGRNKFKDELDMELYIINLKKLF